MRLLIVGNSHVAAVIHAERAGAAAPAKVRFAALGGFMHRLFVVVDDRLTLDEAGLAAQPARVQRYVASMAENLGRFDHRLTDFDAIAIYNGDLPLDRFIVEPLLRELRTGERYSSDFVGESLASVMTTYDVFGLASAVRRVGGRTVHYCPPPFATLSFYARPNPAMFDRISPHNPAVAEDGRHYAVLRKFAGRYAATASRLLTRPLRRPGAIPLAKLIERRQWLTGIAAQAAEDAGVNLLSQDDATIEHGAFTRQRFAKRGVGLTERDQSAAESTHMNEDYGAIWLRNLIAKVRAAA